MKTEAFINQPSPDIFFNSRSHKEAWHYLAYGVNSKEPFLLLSGDYGTGKTTLCLRLIQVLKDGGKLPFVFVSTPTDTYASLLRRIASCLDIFVERDDESNLQSLICSYFEYHKEIKGFSIIVDDVQEMDISTLNKLRLLANFNIFGRFPIRLLLFSHFSFIDKLKIDLLQPLNQRIKRRYYLEPFNFSETREYIYFRLVKAGAQGMPLFTDEAIRIIFDHSKGIPRSINNICDGCLLLGASQGLTTIDKPVVEKAIDYIEGTHVRPTPPAVSPSPEAVQELTLGVQHPSGEDRVSHITLDFPNGEGEQGRKEDGKDRWKGLNLRGFLTIAAIMFILGILFAMIFDFKAFMKSWTDFWSHTFLR
jgi:type II secretory pathway predicted ATPase ExeA